MGNQIAKLSATPAADQSLDRMVNTANEGFTGGRVSKSDLLSWIIVYFEKTDFAASLEKIRQDHFDRLAYLESIVKQMKKAKRDGTDTLDIAALLTPITSEIKSSSARNKLRSKQSEIDTSSD